MPLSILWAALDALLASVRTDESMSSLLKPSGNSKASVLTVSQHAADLAHSVTLATRRVGDVRASDTSFPTESAVVIVASLNDCCCQIAAKLRWRPGACLAISKANLAMV